MTVAVRRMISCTLEGKYSRMPSFGLLQLITGKIPKSLHFLERGIKTRHSPGFNGAVFRFMEEPKDVYSRQNSKTSGGVKVQNFLNFVSKCQCFAFRV